MSIQHDFQRGKMTSPCRMFIFKAMLCFVAGAFVTDSGAQDLNLIGTPAGITIEAGLDTERTDGTLLISHPILNVFAKGGGISSFKPQMEFIDDYTIRYTYENGAEFKATIAKGTVTYAATKLPEDAGGFRIGLTIPRRYGEGGKYSFDGAPLKDLAQEGKVVQLFNGKASSFTLVDPAGKGMTITTPGYMQALRDFQEQSFNTYSWACYMNYLPKTDTTFTVTFGSQAPESPAAASPAAPAAPAIPAATPAAEMK